MKKKLEIITMYISNFYMFFCFCYFLCVGVDFPVGYLAVGPTRV